MVDNAVSETSVEAKIRFRMNYFLCAFDLAMDSHSEERRLLEVHCEPRWSFGPVRYNGQVVKLSGCPSYALWYGDEDEAALNVIVAQGRRFSGSDKGIAEVLGYMGEQIVLLLLLLLLLYRPNS